MSRSILRGTLAGIAGGLFASWVMNEFMAGPGEALTGAVETPRDKFILKHQSGGEDATMHAADKIAEFTTGGRHLTHEQRARAGPFVHYAFGAIAGGVYGALAEVTPAVTSGFGTSFGSVLFTGADALAIPAFKLSIPLKETPPSSLAAPFAAHLVYGISTELIRRLIRKVL
jgi:putative membrane protein